MVIGQQMMRRRANILSRGRLMAFSLPLPLIIIQSTGDTLRRNYLLIYLPDSLFLPYFQDQWPSDCVDECTADVDPIGGGSGRVYARAGQVPQPVRAEGRAGQGRGAAAQRYCDGRAPSVSTVDRTD